MVDIFYFSDIRDVLIVYFWVKVFIEVYGIVFVRSFDGGDISYIKFYDNFNLLIKGFWGSGESDFFSDDYNLIRFNNLCLIGVEFVLFDWSFVFKYI